MHYFLQKLKVRVIDIDAGKLICILNEKTAKELGVFALDRLKIRKNSKTLHAPLDITDTMVGHAEIGLFENVARALNAKNGSMVVVSASEKPQSVAAIKKKVDGKKLSATELSEIVKDINSNRLSEIEVAAFVTGVYVNGLDLDETVWMTKAMIENGKTISFGKKPVLDKHSIGGLNGRASMIIVPIIAAAGYLIPKTSSRTITSAAGTADAMEVLAPVTLSLRKIKHVTQKTGGVLVWGGAASLAPADDKIIRIEHPLSLDPKGQIIASVMAKKASVGAKFLVIDVPFGEHVKIKTKKEALEMGKKFLEVGKKIGIKVAFVVTDGSKPSGNAFGPALEARLALEVLEGKVFDNLARKSLLITGKLLELAGYCKKGEGFLRAKKILESGAALKKMQEIITAQGGKTIWPEQIKQAEFKKTIHSETDGKVKKINIKHCLLLARSAGAPADKLAGMVLLAKEKQKVHRGMPLFEIHAEHERKLHLAWHQQQKMPVMEIG